MSQTAPPPVPERVDRVGPRTWLMAALAAISTFDTTLMFNVGPIIAAAVYLSGRPLRLRMSSSVLLSIAFLIWVAASSMWSSAPDAVLTHAKVWASLLIVFVVMLDFIRTTQQLRIVTVAYLLGAFSAVTRMAVQNPDVLTGEGSRATLEGMNANYLGYAFSTGFALVMLLWVTKRRTLRIRVGLVAVIGALALGIYLTGTRGALLSLALLIAWILICRMHARPPLRGLVILIFTIAVLLVTGIADRASLIFETGSRSTGDWSGRLRIWPLARDIWADHPLFGIGGGQFGAATGFGAAAHNAILTIGVGLGIVGVLMFVGIFWSTLRPVAREHAFLVGAFLVTTAPSYLSGVWETAPAGWVALAIFGRALVHEPDEIENPRDEGTRSRSTQTCTSSTGRSKTPVPASRYTSRPAGAART